MKLPEKYTKQSFWGWGGEGVFVLKKNVGFKKMCVQQSFDLGYKRINLKLHYKQEKMILPLDLYCTLVIDDVLQPQCPNKFGQLKLCLW